MPYTDYGANRFLIQNLNDVVCHFLELVSCGLLRLVRVAITRQVRYDNAVAECGQHF